MNAQVIINEMNDEFHAETEPSRYMRDHIELIDCERLFIMLLQDIRIDVFLNRFKTVTSVARRTK
jgi:hypothetical protein